MIRDLDPVKEPDADAGTVRLSEPVATVSLRVPRLRVVVVDGPNRGLDVTPDHLPITVGTNPNVELALTDAAISRHHCQLSIRRSGIRVVDLRSSNGTFVEGIRIREADVPVGSLLRIGTTTLRLTTAEETIQPRLSASNRFGGLIGTSPRMREAFAILERIAPTDTTLLIEGETGTGKEVAAEAAHAASGRAEEPFVVFDCTSVPADLMESALFGHVRGAFTGAVSDRLGAFEEADGGTLFLDEIGELPLELQPKLLRVLEKREVRRVGASTTRQVDVRIIAATNRSLEVEVNAGRFREDLFYRLAVVRVVLPPLRARREDIPLLIEHFLEQLTEAGGRPPRLREGALGDLGSRSWRGNVRELRNAVERAVRLARTGDPTVAVDAADVGDESLCLPLLEARDRLVEQFERRYLEAALKRHNANISAIAREARVNRKLIQRLLQKHALRPSRE